MAYTIEKGLLRPNEFPPDTEEEEVPPEEVENKFPDIKASFPATHALVLGSRVRRKIRPFQIGVVEWLQYLPGTNQIGDVWVSFEGREATPYPLDDLEQVMLH